MVTVCPGFLASNRRLASKRTTFLLSSIAQWLHHCSSVAWAADAASSHAHSVSGTIRIDSRIGVLLVELGPARPRPEASHFRGGAARLSCQVPLPVRAAIESLPDRRPDAMLTRYREPISTAALPAAVEGALCDRTASDLDDRGARAVLGLRPAGR